jgi:hypothetical protein
VGTDNHPRPATATARQFLRRQRVVFPAVFPELRKLDPGSSLSPAPKRQRVRSGVPRAVLVGTPSFDRFGHEEQLLVGRGCVTLTTLAKKHPLQQPQLLRGSHQLLLASGEHFLLLRDDGLLLSARLLQLTNSPLTGCQLIGKRWTSVIHAHQTLGTTIWFCRRAVFFVAVHGVRRSNHTTVDMLENGEPRGRRQGPDGKREGGVVPDRCD